VKASGSVMVWGCISAFDESHLSFCDGGINAEKSSTEIFEQNMMYL